MLVAVSKSVLSHGHISLLLEGLDTVVNVTLNNVLILRAHNMFQRFLIDITHIIQVYLVIYLQIYLFIY